MTYMLFHYIFQLQFHISGCFDLSRLRLSEYIAYHVFIVYRDADITVLIKMFKFAILLSARDTISTDDELKIDDDAFKNYL